LNTGELAIAYEKDWGGEMRDGTWEQEGNESELEKAHLRLKVGVERYLEFRGTSTRLDGP